ncbi:MAG: beta-glucosidase BglX [Salinivirgaceae bacterium]|jgi:beta-glucosidase|nr:beta-glucosidase BglX [Salinivirgaceae bacterium]
MKNILPIILLASLTISCTTKQNNSDKTMNHIDHLLSQMTLKEKIAQLNLITALDDYNNPLENVEDKVRNGEVGHILKSNGVKNNFYLQKIAIEESRLGIPIMFQEDVIHGYKTAFPGPLAEAASWNLERIEQTAAAAAKEATASGIQLTYAPMVDITRDPRWGRIVEGAGEDPYLGSLIAKARVKGFQGDNLADSSTLMACAKHFLGYGDAMAGIDYNIGDFSERELREIYLPPFKAAIESGVGSMMVAYSAIDGVPATANKWLMQDLLRDELGFDGIVISDWRTVSNLVKTGVATNNKDATHQAIEAGLDIDMVSELYVQNLEELVNEGKVDIKLIDKAVRRVLKAKTDLGLFDDPYVYFDSVREKKWVMHPSHLELSRKAARESMVLLKNARLSGQEKHLLPLSKSVNSIAVIGPLATRQKDLLSWWAANHSQADKNDVVSLLHGIKAAVSSSTKVTYTEGIILEGFEKKGLELIPAAIKAAKQADVVILALGEEYWMSGEGGSISDITLPGAQPELVEALAQTGKPVVAVLINGRPFDIRKTVESFDAVLEAWQPGTMGGYAIADILFGDFNPCGKLPVTFPQNTGQIPIFYNIKRGSHDFEGIDLKDRYKNNYLDITHKPLFPFGFGLSYTTFEYSNLRVNTDTDIPTVGIKVTNSGKVDGFEVVQLYIKDIVTQVATPHKQLKGFERIFLKAGESKVVTFNITDDKLSYIGKELKPLIEAGEFEIMVGGNSEELLKVVYIRK